MKIYRMVSKKSNVFLFFQVTHFPPGKWRVSCVSTSVHAAHFLIELEYFLIVILELVEQLSRKPFTCVSSSPGKDIEKKERIFF